VVAAPDGRDRAPAHGRARTRCGHPGPAQSADRPSGRRPAAVPIVEITEGKPTEIIAKYHDLWHVEKSFRMSKTDLRARPMHNRVREAIEARLTIVFTARAVARCIQARTDLSIGKVARQLRPLRSATITINGASQTLPPAIPEAHRKILTHLGIDPGHQKCPNSGQCQESCDKLSDK
jgi:hypothetical protein